MAQEKRGYFIRTGIVELCHVRVYCDALCPDAPLLRHLLLRVCRPPQLLQRLQVPDVGRRGRCQHHGLRGRGRRREAVVKVQQLKRVAARGLLGRSFPFRKNNKLKNILLPPYF